MQSCQLNKQLQPNTNNNISFLIGTVCDIDMASDWVYWLFDPCCPIK